MREEPARPTSKPRFAHLVELFERSVRLYGGRELFGQRELGTLRWTTYAEVGALVDATRAGLSALGLRRGERVCLVAGNRIEWAVVAYAAYGLGLAVVPLDEAIPTDEVAFVVRDSAAAALFAGGAFEACDGLRAAVPTLRSVHGFDLPAAHPRSFRALLELGRATRAPSVAPSAADTACLLYTSGTTGHPKGVVLSHANVASNIVAVHECFPITGDDRSLSFLPWAHSFGHTCELHTLLSAGGSIALATAPERLLDEVADAQPTVLMSVPRLFHRLYDQLARTLADRPPRLGELVRRATDAHVRRRSGASLGVVDRMTLALAEKVLFAELRARFGGRLRFAVSGGAALSREVADLVDAIGVTVFEGYGLTETSPIVTVNRPGARRPGSVGQPIPGVRVRIDPAPLAGAARRALPLGASAEGEVLVYGPNVMRGYHERPDDTESTLLPDGGLRTGDLGYLDADGYLHITGRVKEQYKLENGRYVAPGPLEERMRLSPFVQRGVVFGENRPYNVAVVVPDAAALRAWAAEQGLAVEPYAQLLEHPVVRAKLLAEVAARTGELRAFERVEAVALVADDFSVQNGLLTASLKVKRREVERRYGSLLAALYPPRRSLTPPPVPRA